MTTTGMTNDTDLLRIVTRGRSESARVALTCAADQLDAFADALPDSPAAQLPASLRSAQLDAEQLQAVAGYLRQRGQLYAVEGHQVVAQVAAVDERRAVRASSRRRRLLAAAAASLAAIGAVLDDALDVEPAEDDQ